VLSAIASRNAQAAEDCMRVLLTAAHRDARLSLASKPVKADPAAIQ
jgi:DNA-binding GntR family transcriptional regulator